jgi:hypothetical protein
MKIMMKKSSLLVSMGILMSQGAMAVEWDVSGFVRAEVAVKTSEMNWAGNSFNGKSVANTGLAGPATLTRPGSQANDTDFNLFATRLELDAQGIVNDNISLRFKLRGFADHIAEIEDAYDDINMFEQQFSGKGGTHLETAGDNWMLDMPVAYLDYSDGPLWVRLGNQQIAWGEALFFRVSDVPNGLDLRRHSVLDVVAEEYSDKRVPGLGVRSSYRIKENIELEGFAQFAQPSIIPNENSPYNVIPAQFVIQEDVGYDNAEGDINFGAKLRFESGNLGGHIFAVRRTDPNGVFKWTESKGSGALAGSAFQGTTGNGVYSAAEWFHYASLARLDGIKALESALNDFAIGSAAGFGVAQGCGAAAPVNGQISIDSQAVASCTLDTFFASGDLRGHLSREYMRENVFGFAANYIFEGEPDSFMDQLIGRFELSYTPDKKFTNPSLGDYIEADETQFALILEKYHKFSAEFPATYMVAQWLHKTESDLFGRHLSGMNNTAGSSPTGKDSFNAWAFALQQPSPTLEWRFDLAILNDFNGGWLIQPGTRWNPNKDMQIDIYANILESDGGGDDFAEGLEYSNEIFSRFTYFF